MPTPTRRRLLSGVARRTLLQDSFTDTDSTALASHVMNVGGGWTAQTGTIIVTSNRAKINTVTSALALVTANAGKADVTLTCVVNSSATTGTKGVVLRYVDLNNHFICVINYPSNLFEIYDRVAGTFTSRASAAFTATANVDHTIRVTCTGGLISATVNGGSAISYGSATAGQTSTLFGIRGSDINVSFDDFLVTG